MLPPPFFNMPIWLCFLISFAIIWLAFEGGIYLGKKHRLSSTAEDRSPIGSTVPAALGLLVFLLAFTFGIAASKFDERRTLIVKEANAIGTTYLRAGYLNKPYRTKIIPFTKNKF